MEPANKYWTISADKMAVCIMLVASTYNNNNYNYNITIMFGDVLWGFLAHSRPDEKPSYNPEKPLYIYTNKFYVNFRLDSHHPLFIRSHHDTRYRKW